MPKRINYQLNGAELKQIEEAQRTAPDARVRQRATGLCLLHLGKKPGEVAELLNVSQATIFNWHADWRAEGIAGLSDKARSGRPPLADEAYRAKVEVVIETDQLGLWLHLLDDPTLNRPSCQRDQDSGQYQHDAQCVRESGLCLPSSQA